MQQPHSGKLASAGCLNNAFMYVSADTRQLAWIPREDTLARTVPREPGPLWIFDDRRLPVHRHSRRYDFYLRYHYDHFRSSRKIRRAFLYPPFLRPLGVVTPAEYQTKEFTFERNRDIFLSQERKWKIFEIPWNIDAWLIDKKNLLSVFFLRAIHNRIRDHKSSDKGKGFRDYSPKIIHFHCPDARRQ